MSSMKYFVFSDIHSCLDKLKVALMEAGYDENNNEVISEQFNTKEKVLELIQKYQPTLISNEEIDVGEYKVDKQSLDIIKITSYYQNKEINTCNNVDAFTNVTLASTLSLFNFLN